MTTDTTSRFSDFVLGWAIWIYFAMGGMAIFVGLLMVLFATHQGQYQSLFWLVFGKLALNAIPPLATGIAVWFRSALAVPLAWLTTLLYLWWVFGRTVDTTITGDPSASDRIVDIVVLVAALIMPPLLTIVWRKGALKGRNT